MNEIKFRLVFQLLAILTVVLFCIFPRALVHLFSISTWIIIFLVGIAVWVITEVCLRYKAGMKPHS